MSRALTSVGRLLALLLCSTAPRAFGHEVRPAYLEINELGDGELELVWKQPLRDGMRLRIDPVLPALCTRVSAAAPDVSAGAAVERSRWRCPAGIEGQTIAVAGLERTLTDALVQVRFADGERVSHILRPDARSWRVTRGGAPAWSYLRLGVEHLLFGFDHILFVIGLLFLVRRPLALVQVITSFTVAHSITLALSSLGVVRLRPAPVEAAIALSILYLAVELMRPEAPDAPSWTRRFPWSIAFGFGLLHGFGFAGALAEIGLPHGARSLALLLFNVGVELGQLVVVAVVLVVAATVRAAALRVPAALVQAPVILMGAVSAYWLIERAARLLG